MITDGRTGYLVPVDDVPVLTETLLRSGGRAPRSLPKSACVLETKSLTTSAWAAMAERTFQVYERLVRMRPDRNKARSVQEHFRRQLGEIGCKL